MGIPQLPFRKKPVFWLLVIMAGGLLPSCVSSSSSAGWRSELREEIKALGYKNWIVVADAAFPYYNRPGVRTVTAAAQTPHVIDQVVQAIDEVQHVKPQFYTARELREVSNRQAPGAGTYRSALERSLHGYEPRELDHKTLMRLLDSTSSHFTVLVIKTQTALPYASVFIELDSGYWDGDLEGELRKALEEKKKLSPPEPAARETVRALLNQAPALG